MSGGEVLAALKDEHGIARDQMFVIAKAGYPSGQMTDELTAESGQQCMQRLQHAFL